MKEEKKDKKRNRGEKGDRVEDRRREMYILYRAWRHSRRSVCTSLVCEKRARLPRATRASKYWLLFESVIRCLRTHGFSPTHAFLPTYLPLPFQPSQHSASIPHADIYTTPVCSLYFWLRGKFDISVGPGQFLRGDAIYCLDVSVARKSPATKDPLSLTRCL